MASGHGWCLEGTYPRIAGMTHTFYIEHPYAHHGRLRAVMNVVSLCSDFAGTVPSVERLQQIATRKRSNELHL
jgi:hypothetical protein